MTSFKPNYHPKAPFSATITLGLRASTYGFVRKRQFRPQHHEHLFSSSFWKKFLETIFSIIFSLLNYRCLIKKWDVRLSDRIFESSFSSYTHQLYHISIMMASEWKTRSMCVWIWSNFFIQPKDCCNITETQYLNIFEATFLFKPIMAPD